MVFSTIDVRLQYILPQDFWSPFELTYGMKPRLPFFPIPELSRINYGEGLVAERLQLLKKARLYYSYRDVITQQLYQLWKVRSAHRLFPGIVLHSVCVP
jgi:hypothetical protein